MSDSPLKILMITSELEPFAKIGGLADMVGALSAQLGALGVDVRVVLPRYYSVDVGRLRRINGPLGVPVGGGEEWCAVYESRIPDTEVPVYFLDHEELYGRDGIYGTRMEPGFRDNLRRFTVLCRGSLQLAKLLEWLPDVVHGHDWPAALAPVYLNTLESHGFFEPAASLLTIHNLGYQGEFPIEEFPYTGLAEDQLRAAGFEFRGRLNLLRAGLRGADLLTAVSPTYASEIQTQQHGHRMDGLLRRRAADLVGVLNGMDYDAWNPRPTPTSRSTTRTEASAARRRTRWPCKRRWAWR